MTCRLCAWLRALFKDAGPDCGEVWDHVWRETDAWDEARANDGELLHDEDDTRFARIQAAFEIAKTDPAAAFRLYQTLAEEGSPWAMHRVAWHYHVGEVVPEDFEMAADYYRRAIDGGSWSATTHYARLLAGHGDHAEAEAVLEDGVEKDFAPACFWLAWLRYKHAPGREAARRNRALLEHAAAQGHPAAKAVLARWLTTGKLGLREIPKGIRMTMDSMPAAFRATREHDAAKPSPAT